MGEPGRMSSGILIFKVVDFMLKPLLNFLVV